MRMDDATFLSMLGGGMPSNEAAQMAAPSVQQPGGGSQLVNGLTPQQQELMNVFDLFSVQGKQLSAMMKTMTYRQEANDLDAMLVKVTKTKLALESEMKEEAVDKAIASAVSPSSAQTQTMAG